MDKTWGVVLGVILLIALFLAKTRLSVKTTIAPSPTPQAQTQSPQVISTNPSPLEEATITPSQTIEITFNQPLVNEPYTLVKIEPSADFKVSLSNNNKTVQITPTKPYQLGSGYSITIDALTKFQGDKILGQNLIYHFKTISYSGV